MLTKGYKLRSIALVLDRSVSTISEEIKRNTVAGEYTAKKAHHKAVVRRRTAKFQGKKIVDDDSLRLFVETELLKQQSPSAISGRLKTGKDRLPYVSRDTIEEYIKSVHGRRVEYELKLLKRARKRRRKKRPNPEGLQERTFIDDRPPHIAARRYVGDVEADFIVSGRTGTGYLLTVVDRRSRYGFIQQILPVSIVNVEQAFLAVQKQFPELTSITTDNDILFRHHKRLEKLLGGIPIYFCHPYASWEKGTNENYNKHVRKYIPKGADISQYNQEYLTFIEDRLNGRFMSVINYQTPEEYLTAYLTAAKKKPR